MDNNGINLIKDLLAELIINCEELGPSCDHSNNFRVCKWKNLIDVTKDYLESQKVQEVSKSDAWNKLIGNEYLKRTIEISIAGNHPITIIGNPDNGEELLKTILGDLLTFINSCPCGNFMNIFRTCSCTTKEIVKYKNTKKYRKALLNPILSILQTPTKDQYSRISETFKDVIDRINRIKKLNNPNIEKEAINLLNTVNQKFGFTLQQIERIKNVAKTIAELDQDTEIKTFHMSEAISYQLLDNQ